MTGIFQSAGTLVFGPFVVLVVNFLVELGFSIVLFAPRENEDTSQPLTGVNALRQSLAGLVGGALGIMAVMGLHEWCFGEEIWYLAIFVLCLTGSFAMALAEESPNLASWPLSLGTGMTAGIVLNAWLGG